MDYVRECNRGCVWVLAMPCCTRNMCECLVAGEGRGVHRPQPGPGQVWLLPGGHAGVGQGPDTGTYAPPHRLGLLVVTQEHRGPAGSALRPNINACFRSLWPKKCYW